MCFVANVNTGGIGIDYLQADFFGLHFSRPLPALFPVHLLPGDR
jgi:hypothetical protein